MSNMRLNIYSFFEDGIRIKKYDSVGAEIVHENSTYTCKLCVSENKTNKNGKAVTINCTNETSSNLSTHLKRAHQNHWD